MRVHKFQIDSEDAPRLELRWQGTDAWVYLDGEHRCTLQGLEGLRRGCSFVLEDGSTLEVRAIRRALLPELAILRNGRHVESSPSHPEKMLKASSTGLLWVSAFLVVIGTFGLWGRTWLGAAFGISYLIGALLIRRRSLAGTLFVAIPVVIDLTLSVLVAFQSGITGRWLVHVATMLLVGSFVIRSFQAVRDTRKLERLGAAV